MTSECYVYITLPGETHSTTAGRFESSVNKDGTVLGRFVYGRKYLESQTAVEFDPIELKLTSEVFETTSMNGVFGALRDASPDYWGRRLIEKKVGKTNLTELDYLLYSPDDRAGALSFGLNQNPPAPIRKFNQTIHLETLQRSADLIMSGETKKNDAGQIKDLLLLSTSMGGARPKAVVEDQDGLWLAKFNRNDDRWNSARVEHSMLTLARLCGISSAESRVVSVAGRDVLLVKRFDREKTKAGYFRFRMMSALTLLGADDTYYSHGRWSYVFLAEELRRISAYPDKDATELFRRMCFNALISNIDDHPRNHAIIAKDQNWHLPPAYDLTPSTPISPERQDLALIAGDAGRFANAQNLLSQCNRFLMNNDKAEAMINEMETKIKSQWHRISRQSGVTEEDCETISDAFAYPGFRF